MKLNIKPAVFFLAFLSLCLWIPSVCAETANIDWVKLYRGPAGGDDFATAIAVDGPGNAHVTGKSQNADGTSTCATLKYGPDGSIKWTRRYNTINLFAQSAGASAIGLDSSANVFVSGMADSLTEHLWFVVKYAQNGSVYWSLRHPNGDIDLDINPATSIAVDANTPFTAMEGHEDYAGPGVDYRLNLVGGSGTGQWHSYFFSGPGVGKDSPAAIAAGDGRVFVTGSSAGSDGSSDYMTVMYQWSGTISAWKTRYEGPPGSDDHATAIAVDGSDNAYVTGYSTVGSGPNPGHSSNHDFLTIKYDKDGNQGWVQRYYGLLYGEDRAVAIGLDGASNVYVTGSSTVGTGTKRHYTTIKYNKNGIRQWVKTYYGPQSGDAVPVGMGVDGSGNVFVTGYYSVGDGTNYHWATVKYDTAGNQKWLKCWSGPSGGGGRDARPSAIALDSAGNAFVTGYCTDNNGKKDYATIKISSHP